MLFVEKLDVDSLIAIMETHCIVDLRLKFLSVKIVAQREKKQFFGNLENKGV